ncbi:MAG: hypothetical protein LBH25_13760 [Fibromonadaceae bacterium]|jgi:hypothetical protein|nr:hypothetical protein [Fibromonadaceae bacterium]
MKTNRFPLINSKHFARYGISITLLIVVFLLSSCATTSITLSEEYRSKVRKENQPERIIDRVILYTGKYGLHREPQNWFRDCNSVSTSPETMGSDYTVLGENAKERHRDERILDSLFNVVKEEYPDDEVDIRDATSQYKYISFLGLGGGCQRIYFADVVSTEPMPAPVTHSVELPVEGNKDDAYKRVDTWFDDRKYDENKTNVGVKIQRADPATRRISGDYIFLINYGKNSYKITSAFNIDIWNDKPALLSFKSSLMERNVGKIDDKDTQSAETNIISKKTDDKKGSEPIFLQSIANLVKAELIRFSEELKSGVTN